MARRGDGAIAGTRLARRRQQDVRLDRSIPSSHAASRQPTTHMDWKDFWDTKADEARSDAEFDRGVSERDPRIDALARHELVEFIDPHSAETLLDAGCGTGANVALLAGKVGRVIAMDYSLGALERCKRRLEASNAADTGVLCGSITRLPLSSRSVDRIICLSVLQYVDDDGVRSAFGEFGRVLRPGGVLVIHVKNLASIYLATLRAAKKVKAALGRPTKMEHVRTFNWYLSALHTAGFRVITYNSFNIFVVEGMPRRLLDAVQRAELQYRQGRFFGNRLARRSGADLKIRASYAPDESAPTR